MHLKNPWVTAFWSFVQPGLGFLIMGSYIKGFLLIITASIVNSMSHLNQAIVLSLTGQVEMAKAIIDIRWMLFFVPILVFAVWSSYQLTVDLNKFSLLAAREDSAIIPFKIDTWEIAFMDKRQPWVGAAFSALLPGLGHLYTHRIPTSFFLLTWWVGSSYMAHFLPALHLSLTGNFGAARAMVDPQWLINLVGIYPYAIYDCYVNTVEYNRLFDREQSRFLIDNYQNPKFPMPIDDN